MYYLTTSHKWIFLFLSIVLFSNRTSCQEVLGDDCSNALSGTVYVGSGVGTPQYAGFKQLFDAINLYGIGSDLLVLVQNDVVETAQATLNPVTYHCGSSDWTINIQPASATLKTISSTANALIHFNGVTNIIIDGHYNGNGRNLRFRSSVSNQAALVVNDGTYGVEIKNSIFEATGANTNVIRLGASGAAVHDILIEGNEIRNRSDLTQDAASRPFAGIGSIGAGVSDLNHSISILNNSISNFIQSGVNVGSSNNGPNFIITGNRLYSTIVNGGNAVTVPINFGPGTSSYSNVIADNIIGGNAADNTGIWLNPVNQQMTGILVSVGGSTPDNLSTIVSGNTISGINMTASTNGYSTFSGIEVIAGRVKVIDNTVGSLTQPDAILSAGDGMLSGGLLDFVGQVYGIWNKSADSCEVSGNTVANMTSIAPRGYTKMCGIRNGSREYYMNGQGSLANLPCGQVIVHDNLVTALRSTSSLTRLGNSTDCPGHPGGVSGIMVMSNVAGSIISKNAIHDIENTLSERVRGTIVVGLSVDGTGPTGHSGQALITGNIIYDLRNANEGTASIRSEVVGIAAGTLVGVTSQGTTQGRGSYTMVNNMVSLSPVAGNQLLVVGIMDQIQSPGITQYYNNSIYIGGDGTASLSSSGAFVHWPNRGVASTGASVTLRNNLLVNNRTGLNNAYAITCYVNGTTDVSSDYNFVSSNVDAQTASWQNLSGNLFYWQTNSLVDNNSNTAVTTTVGNSSATTLNVNELFVDVNNDLHLIDTDNQWPLEHVVGQGLMVVGVDLDIDDQPRSTPPTIGADELYEEQCIEPSTETIAGSLSVCENNDVSLNISTSGTSLNFQWQVFVSGGNEWQDLANDGAYDGVNTAMLEIVSSELSLSGNQYRLVVSNDCGETLSNIIVLTVDESTLYYPDNDNDGHGDMLGGIYACEQPVGYSTVGNDCDDTDPLIWLAKPAEIEINLGIEEVCLNESSFELEGAEPGGGVWSGAGVNNGIFTPQDAGVGSHTISYFVAGDGACVLPATGMVVIDVEFCSSVEESAANRIIVFPTQTSSFINVQADQLKGLVLLDSQGRLLESKSISGQSYQLSLDNYATGNYFVCISTSAATQVFKIVKMK